MAEQNPDLATNQKDWQLEFDDHRLFSFTNWAEANAKAESLAGLRPLHEHRAVEYVRKNA